MCSDKIKIVLSLSNVLFKDIYNPHMTHLSITIFKIMFVSKYNDSVELLSDFFKVNLSYI